MSVAPGAWELEHGPVAVRGLQDLAVTTLRHAAHGTHAVLARSPGPLCSVRMFFATEACDNKGLPHCLEHLCFMGSANHSKGFIDLLAMRCGCEGLNAYT